MSSTADPTDWPTYLDDFHGAKAGITEDVLTCCAADGVTPYGWLTEGLDAAAEILDIGCGSGPTMPAGSRSWVGIDLSEQELRRAHDNVRPAVALADATNLPVADASFDVVTCSMALMLVQPLDRGLAEIRRALRPGGRLLLLLPARRPLTMADRASYLRLFWAARSTTKFPSSDLRRDASAALGRHGLGVESDEARRFVYSLDGVAAADRLVDSWYLPATSEPRRAATRARAATMAPRDVGIPLRRVVARKAR